MAGLIPDRDIQAIRDRTRIEEVVGEYVSLKRAGADSLKGLCPFHDEKTPSFHVRPNHGMYHCFGCGQGGDVYRFIQSIEHVGFRESVEMLADRIGYQITYEGGGPSVQREHGTRARLVAANAAAQQFYAEQLQGPDAQAGRQYLLERNFDEASWVQFGLGYAPAGWDVLTKHLLRQGFTIDELIAAGLSREGKRGPIDRFHRRLLWPIRNLATDVIGFGARRLYDDDQITAKYLNTPETVLYKKSEVLFGLDQAKREIAKGHQAVVVEGYTDVMAMQLAGVHTAVAACGTAFGDGHLALLRRLMMDDKFSHSEVIYTFDGDAAGQAAAMKAFSGVANLQGESFVAIAPDGMDPAELRIAKGDAALRDLVARRSPLIEFVLDTVLSTYDLDSAEGRSGALDQAVPLLARIPDRGLRDNYASYLAGKIGRDDVGRGVDEIGSLKARIQGAVRAAQRTAAQQPPRRGTAPEAPAAPRGPRMPRRDDPMLWAQREALKAALQQPAIAGSIFDSLPEDSFTEPVYRRVRQAVAAAGGASSAVSGATWLERVSAQLSEPADEASAMTGLVFELAADELPVSEARMSQYITGVLARLQEVWVGEQVAELKSRLSRLSPATDSDAFNSLMGDLVALEQYRRSLLDQAIGDSTTLAG